MEHNNGQLNVLVQAVRDQHERHEQLAGELRDALGGMARTLTEYTVVLERHINEEERNGRRVDKLIDDHEKRLRDVEEWQVATAAKLPAWIDDAEDLKSDVSQIKLRMAKWIGIATACLVLAQLTVVPVIQGAVKALFAAIGS